MTTTWSTRPKIAWSKDGVLIAAGYIEAIDGKDPTLNVRIYAADTLNFESTIVLAKATGLEYGVTIFSPFFTWGGNDQHSYAAEYQTSRTNTSSSSSMPGVYVTTTKTDIISGIVTYDRSKRAATANQHPTLSERAEFTERLVDNVFPSAIAFVPGATRFAVTGYNPTKYDASYIISQSDNPYARFWKVTISRACSSSLFSTTNSIQIRASMTNASCPFLNLIKQLYWTNSRIQA